VIRTTNPHIVLDYQSKGWFTTTSWDEVLEKHPEWRPEPLATTTGHADKKTTTTVTRVCAALLRSMSASLAFLPVHTPTSVLSTTSLVATPSSDALVQHDEDEEEYRVGKQQCSNSGAVHWLTAVEQKWYWEHGLSTPTNVWTTCTKGDEVFDYRLEDGVWELDHVPRYTKHKDNGNEEACPSHSPRNHSKHS
jgi:hypothetical protein